MKAFFAIGFRAGKQAAHPLKMLEILLPKAFVSNGEAMRMPGVKTILLLFLSYYAAESCMTLWITSFAGKVYALSESQAALMSSLFLLGITAGRGISGFVNMRFSSFTLVRCSVILMLTGILVLLLGSGYIMCVSSVCY